MLFELDGMADSLTEGRSDEKQRKYLKKYVIFGLILGLLAYYQLFTFTESLWLLFNTHKTLKMSLCHSQVIFNWKSNS